MEKYEYPDLQCPEQNKPRPEDHEKEHTEIRETGRTESVRASNVRAIVQEQLNEKARKAFRRKWSGRGLIILGAAIMLSSCPLYAFSLIGPQTLLTGLAMMAGGSALLAWRPRLKDTNEAIIAAVKSGNCLTAVRLALELDISFEKADKIIQELVRSGIAEIDLDHRDPDNSIIYRIKGL